MRAISVKTQNKLSCIGTSIQAVVLTQESGQGIMPEGKRQNTADIRSKN